MMALIWLQIIDHVLWIVLVSDNVRWWSCDKLMVGTTSMSCVFVCVCVCVCVCGTSESEARVATTSNYKTSSSPPNPGFECRRLLLADRLTVARSLSVRKTCRLPTLSLYWQTAHAPQAHCWHRGDRQGSGCSARLRFVRHTRPWKGSP